jgi:hypothetical protein
MLHHQFIVYSAISSGMSVHFAAVPVGDAIVSWSIRVT